ncbi:MAG TPA: LPS export ABC transporter periplasmic protein LptC [Steroidobacteraceae bacterium]|nr:LPS export ABC transporter periplasmic protein LptC [Steroidobacteraceae bacterium]
MTARAALLLVLAILVALVLWLWQGGDSSQGPATVAAPVTAHGYSATNAVLVQTDDQGQVEYHVTATRIDRATPDSDIALTQPTMDYVSREQDNSRGTWQISAQRGIIPAGTRQIDLTGNVVAHGQPVGQPGEIHLATQQLHVDLDQEVATSDAEVNLDWRGSQLRGRGMHATLNGEKLVMNSDVHGYLAR